MKYIMCQPAIDRFEWEVQVAIYGLLKAGVHKEDIVILFSRHEESVVSEIQNLGVNVHSYEDKREDTSYIPSLKPYLMYRYLDEDKTREDEIYFFMDSDVIVRQQPETRWWNRDDQMIWYGSNCNGYLNYDYIIQCENGKQLLEDMTYIVGISPEEVKLINNNCIGAQYLLGRPKAEYFSKVYKDSIKLWNYIKDKDTNLQKWTAEMWATLWNMVYFDIMPQIVTDLDFTWATDDIDLWYQNKIYHNAGVTDEMTDMFFKGSYVNRTPFNKDYSFVNKNKAVYKYVELIKETEDWLK